MSIDAPARNIKWYEMEASRALRRRAAGQNGCVIWLTGLSGSGKSTIAARLEKLLLSAGYIAFVLDGDNLRHGLNKDLGFSGADRKENVRRVAEAASLMAAAGVIVIVSVISPFSEGREEAKRTIMRSGIFTEVFVKADIRTCMARDPKGLYQKASGGGINNFTGISSVYEEPEYPDIIADTDKKSAVYWAGHIYNYITDLQTDFQAMADKIIRIALSAGKTIMGIYEKDFEVGFKDDRSPLTLADKRANRHIVRKLRDYYPVAAVLSEEEKDDADRQKNRFCFIVDPLDGTKEFVKRNGEFTVNIALAYRGKPVLGVVYAPALEKLFYSVPGHGSFYLKTDRGSLPAGERIFDAKHRIAVSDRKLSGGDKLTVMASRSHSDEALASLLERNGDKIGAIVQSGSSLKGCLVAAGEADAYYRTGYTMEWDTAAMQAVVEGAGGVFLQGDGTAMRYNRKDPLNSKGFYILNDRENKFN